MKMILWAAVLSVLLTGCGSRENAEYVQDSPEGTVMALPREVTVDLPGEAAMPTMEQEGRRYYLCNDYEITLDRRPGGDLQQTIEDLTGYAPGDLTVLKTEEPGADRYEFVWVSSGEQGEQLGRAVVLDDGNYHYTLSVLRDAENTEKLQVVWRQVFSSFHLA